MYFLLCPFVTAIKGCIHYAPSFAGNENGGEFVPLMKLGKERSMSTLVTLYTAVGSFMICTQQIHHFQYLSTPMSIPPFPVFHNSKSLHGQSVLYLLMIFTEFKE
mmetsp:Transcript_33668/g.49301  ORF Transcript_33668/g.49301 Transcript_33668/m.49301 type:complete len:105 (-) Transcript_33668:977-1291(-)